MYAEAAPAVHALNAGVPLEAGQNDNKSTKSEEVLHEVERHDARRTPEPRRVTEWKDRPEECIASVEPGLKGLFRIVGRPKAPIEEAWFNEKGCRG